MNISTEHISQCNQSEPLADASGKIVYLMNENDPLLSNANAVILLLVQQTLFYFVETKHCTGSQHVSQGNYDTY